MSLALINLIKWNLQEEGRHFNLALTYLLHPVSYSSYWIITDVDN